MIFQLTTRDDIDSMMTRSSEKPQLLLKHSTRCPMSRLANQDCADLANRRDDFDLNIILAIESADLAREIAEATGIRHESPQAILFVRGRAVWNESHDAVEPSAIEKALFLK